jgi:hypothetical protein
VKVGTAVSVELPVNAPRNADPELLFPHPREAQRGLVYAPKPRVPLDVRMSIYGAGFSPRPPAAEGGLTAAGAGGGEA